MVAVRSVVLVLLCITVISPIVLYTDRLGNFKSPSAKQEFIDEVAAVAHSAGDDGHLNLLPQETSTVLKEPIGVVYTEGSTDSKTSTQDLQLVESSEHVRARVLSTTNVVEQGKTENLIRKVTDGINRKTKADAIGENVRGEAALEGNDTNASQNIVTKQEEQRTGTSNKVANSMHISSETHKPNDQTPSDTRVRQLKDQLVRAKVYLSLPAVKNNPHLTRELRLRVKEVSRTLGDATKDSDLPKNANERMKAMEQSLMKGTQVQDDCAAVVKKLRAMIHSTEEQLRAHKKQTLFLTQLTAKTLPKDNILATAVVVNSTVSNAKHPSKHVIHIVTDRLNYAAMRMWFLANPPGRATIQVQNIEEFTWLNASYSPVLKQLGSPSMIDYYFKAHRDTSDSNLKFRNPKYLSILNHLRFYLPEIFPKLNKVLFLDDDLVVQKDLSGLWSIDLKGNVNGAVETCGESFHRFDRYLNFSNPLIAKNFDPRACGWAYGMNVFDLAEWKRQNITEVYHNWQKLNHDRQLWKLGTLPPGLITFWKRTFSLNRGWHILGLGYNPNVNQREIERSAVLHYNGNMKPWLEISIPKYRNYWSKYVNYDHLFLRECNINP
ncbi:hypothetical protein K1719_006527 [Acacia pycnantha]|nr:hypothetical protein K1719_006527 [Acacia pycnantha]